MRMDGLSFLPIPFYSFKCHAVFDIGINIKQVDSHFSKIFHKYIVIQPFLYESV